MIKVWVCVKEKAPRNAQSCRSSVTTWQQFMFRKIFHVLKGQGELAGNLSSSGFFLQPCAFWSQWQRIRNLFTFSFGLAYPVNTSPTCWQETLLLQIIILFNSLRWFMGRPTAHCHDMSPCGSLPALPCCLFLPRQPFVIEDQEPSFYLFPSVSASTGRDLGLFLFW